VNPSENQSLPEPEAESPATEIGPGFQFDDHRDDLEPPHRTRRWRLSHLMALIAGIAVTFALGREFGGVFLASGLVMLFAVMMGTAVVLARRRIAQQGSLLWILTIAAERGMPLSATIGAVAEQYGGRYQRRVLELARLLGSGSPLPEALDRVPRLVSRDVSVLVRVGHDCGRLPQALRLAATARSSSSSIWTEGVLRLAYLLGLLLVIEGIVGFMLYFILPKLEVIFIDFGVPLPAPTVWLISGANALGKTSYLTFWIVPVQFLLLIYLPFSVAGWSRFDVPFLDGALRRRHSALVLRGLALVVDSGRTLESGLAVLATHYPTWWIRRKLLKAERKVVEGVDWIDALLQQNLIRGTDADVLRTATAVGNLSWAMHELAETIERRLLFRFQWLVQTLFPLVLICLGLLVGFLAIAFFSPLIELIGRLAE